MELVPRLGYQYLSMACGAVPLMDDAEGGMERTMGGRLVRRVTTVRRTRGDGRLPRVARRIARPASSVVGSCARSGGPHSISPMGVRVSLFSPRMVPGHTCAYHFAHLRGGDRLTCKQAEAKSVQVNGRER